MSIIGYLRRCVVCEIQMIVTAEAKAQQQCTDCLDELIATAIEKAGGHSSIDHHSVSGRCTADCYDPDYGVFKCLCHSYDEERP